MKHNRSRKPRLFTVTACGVLGILLSAPALPHGGGLNSSGCHNDNVNGGHTTATGMARTGSRWMLKWCLEPCWLSALSI